MVSLCDKVGGIVKDHKKRIVTRNYEHTGALGLITTLRAIRPPCLVGVPGPPLPPLPGESGPILCCCMKDEFAGAREFEGL